MNDAQLILLLEYAALLSLTTWAVTLITWVFTSRRIGVLVRRELERFFEEEEA